MEKKDTTVKTIRLDNESIDKIQKLANENERDFSSQVRYMLKEYIRIREGK